MFIFRSPPPYNFDALYVVAEKRDVEEEEASNISIQENSACDCGSVIGIPNDSIGKKKWKATC